MFYFYMSLSSNIIGYIFNSRIYVLNNYDINSCVSYTYAVG